MKNVKFENVEVYGFKHTLRNFRNAMESWEDSDSTFGEGPLIFPNNTLAMERPVIGLKDLGLVSRLVKAGAGHRKFLRTIHVWCELSIPRYVWTEIDTAKIGTVRNSCSTMYKIAARDLVPENFAETDDTEEFEWLLNTISRLNELGQIYRDNGKSKEVLQRIKRNLPEGYIQKAGYQINYEGLLNMFYQRKNHKLDEWRFTGDPSSSSICDWIQQLPYMNKIIEAAKKC